MNQRFQPDGRSNRKRMLGGDQYIADDPDLGRESSRAANLTAPFNNTAGEDHAGMCADSQPLQRTEPIV